ncbi:MAG: FAD-dependent oxidoreductase [Candidatus Devosia phytovorans]|uniref:FAD-dependent oxidoreductase n=1 Tax=Candidatus Devosia phytovorans TaxID=3121372 RepID=A0AAJ6B1N3_9HYPH|nr:FAD-dependent oxidoreductase [Devosia sp.]WEK06457.1 MAG: FAD-dependent oxidoreductase [Devosia sp.]
MALSSDLQNIPGGNHADVAIVGAGAVGLLLAADLARAGKRVLLLEAGQTDPNAADYVFDEISSAGRRFTGLQEGRFRTLGGTTTQWGGQLVPLEPMVFGERDWLAESGWPIESTELAEAYQATFDLLGMRGRLSEREVWQQLRAKPPATGDDLDLFLTRWAPEPNFARQFARDLRDNPRLVALTGATVSSLFLQGGGQRVGLNVTSGTGNVRITAGAVVLANGTIEIARLLMLPLEGAGVAPWASNPWLGRGFVDHVDVDAGLVRVLDVQRFHDVFDAAVLGGLKYLPKLKLSEQAQRRDRLLGVAAHFVSTSARTAQLTALKTMARNLINRTALEHEGLDFRHLPLLLDTIARTAERFLLHRRIYNPDDGGILLRLTGEQMMVRESGLALTDQRDTLGRPRATLDWRVDGVELGTLASFAVRVADYLERAGLAEVEIDPQLLARDPAFLERIEDGFHHMGMARMGASPSDGVVDRELKVFGTNNLFVAGAATFRSAGFANPTLTALALALRLSRALQSGTP